MTLKSFAIQETHVRANNNMSDEQFIIFQLYFRAQIFVTNMLHSALSRAWHIKTAAVEKSEKIQDLFSLLCKANMHLKNEDEGGSIFIPSSSKLEFLGSF